MSLPAERRINMSLEEVIKTKQPKKKNNNINTKKPNNSKQATPVKTNKMARRGSKGSATSPIMNRSQSTTSIVKVAKVAGAAKAKRNANLDNKRGMRANNTPTKAEVKTQVNKQVASGLKISFRPQDLPKTTEKAVSMQIKAVLARTPTRPASANSAKTANTASTGRSVTARSNATPTPRKNPKARGNKIMRVQR